MKSTYEKIILADPKRKKEFDKEYNNLLISEFLLEKMQEKKLTVNALAKKAGVSPTIIQKIRKDGAAKINFRTFSTVINTLGYQVNFKKII